MTERVSIAIVHDWLTGMRGGEKVLEVLCELYPRATLHTLLHHKGSVSPRIEGMKIKTSFLQHVPGSKSRYRHLLPLFPAATESFDFSRFDVILSTSHAVAKGAIPAPGALHICYCHTPMRYVWEMYDAYFGKGNAGPLTRAAMRLIAPSLRHWDVESSRRVHYFVANSLNVARRIRETYGRHADVIHPPVDLAAFRLSRRHEGFYLIVSALVPYKRIDLAVQAFTRMNKRLKIVGTGPGAARLKQHAGPTVEFLGWLSDADLARQYEKCRAVVFPGVEDFGIVPLEAMACGKPVIAFGRGGVLETVREGGKGRSGIFFHEQTVEALIEAVGRAEKETFDPVLIRKGAENFDVPVFRERMSRYVHEHLSLR
ncbi:MAG: glycosyltransferase [Bacteroidota bacterium]